MFVLFLNLSVGNVLLERQCTAARTLDGHDRETVSELGDRPVLNITKKPDNTSELVTKNIGLLNCGVKTRQRLIVQDLLPSVLCYLLALSSALGILSTASCLLFIPALPFTILGVHYCLKA
nr:uncharacterized protein LOC119187756 isoform X3 [Rhipicephalus microplus]